MKYSQEKVRLGCGVCVIIVECNDNYDVVSRGVVQVMLTECYALCSKFNLLG